MLRSLLMLLFAPSLFGQAADAVLTQTLITEIRALRQNIESITVVSQRVQIVLYRLQSQTTLVDGAQRRLDSARARVAEIVTQKRGMTSEVAAIEDRLRSTQNPEDRKRAEEFLPRLKAEIEGFTLEEGVRRGAEADADSQLRAEKAKLAELQTLLDRLDKGLDDLARARQQ